MGRPANVSDDKLIDLLVKRGLFSSRKHAIDTLIAYAMRDLIQEEFFKKKMELLDFLRERK